MDSKEAFITSHAALVLAALISRRTSTSPEGLTEQAVATTAKLYDEIQTIRSGNGAGNGEMKILLDNQIAIPV